MGEHERSNDERALRTRKSERDSMTVHQGTPKTNTLDLLEIRFVESEEDLRVVREIRRRVFGLEQGISDADDPDPDDSRSLHAVAVLPEGVVGVGRLTLPSGTENGAQIAWVATLADYRK